VLASQEAADQPARWYETDIEAAVDAAGALLAARVAASSGRGGLDEAALAAVRAAIVAQPVRDPRGPTVARFRVAAARAVRLPRTNPVLRRGRLVGLSPQVPIAFDEVRGEAHPITPFAEEVRTRVTLLSVAPLD
jgi:TonB family protein